MKLRNMLFLAALMATGTVLADDYDYFVVQNSDGEATTFTANGLRMTFANGKLLATQDGKTTELPQESLSTMFFTNKDATAIETVVAGNDTVTVYSLGGVRMGEGTLQEMKLPKGVYIVDKNGSRTKVLVK